MSKYERPEYETVHSEPPFEVREYKDFYIVEYDNTNDPEIGNGFGTLFRYISSDNATRQKISMTVPVIEEIVGDQMKMAFVVPKEQWDHIPEPNNPWLSVKKFDSGLFAVLRYTGFSSGSKEQQMIEKLKGWMETKGYLEASNFMLAFYNPPFTPPMFRRNEIMVRISQVPV